MLTFLTSLIVVPAGGRSEDAYGTPLDFASSVSFQPPVLLGFKIHPENPLLFDFIVDQGQSKLSTEELKEETIKLVKYFLAALTIPDKEVWVNLSPTEKDRIIPDVLGQTTMGKTMLEQDYVLKQLAASLTNPDTDLGKKYWTNVGNGLKPFPTMETSQTAFNKVWIVPAKAEVLESNGIVLVGEKRLKVMMAEDRSLDGQNSVGAMAAKNNVGSGFKPDQDRTGLKPVPTNEINNISSQIFRQTILPTIEKAVNEGKDFADVRQIYNSVILAAWYKKALKESLLGKIYTDKGKVAGVETDDKEMKQRIYEQYLAAFNKGAYNFIKEEADESGDLIPRKYFSGGITPLATNVTIIAASPGQMESQLAGRSTISSAAVELAEPADAEVVASAAVQDQDGSTSVTPRLDNVAVAEKLINNLPNDEENLRTMLRGMDPALFLVYLNALIRVPDHEKYLTIEDLNDVMLAQKNQLTYVGKNSLIDTIVRYKNKQKPNNGIPTMEYVSDFMRDLKAYRTKIFFHDPLIQVRKDLAGNDLSRVNTTLEILRSALSGILPERTPEFYKSIFEKYKSLGDSNIRFERIYTTFKNLKALQSKIEKEYVQPEDAAEQIIRLLAGAPAPRGQSMRNRLIGTAMEAAAKHRESRQLIKSLTNKVNSSAYPNSEYLKDLKSLLNSPVATRFVGNTQSSVASAPIAPVGGIDFDPTNMNLQIKRDGRGVALPLPQQNIEQINIQGLFPVIINIVPINAQTLPTFLGQVPQDPVSEPQLMTTKSG